MGLIGFIFGKIKSVYDFYRYLTNLPLIVALGAAHQAKSTIFATITFGAFLLVITWLSIFTYISCYYYFLPTLLQTKDVNLQYSSNCNPGEKGSCEFPQSDLTLVPSGYPNVLANGQAYAVSLILEMPESDVNRHTGMVMINVDLWTHEHRVTRKASRAVSTVMRYKSPLLQLIETAVYFPFYVLGFMEQKQVLEVELFSNIIDDPYNPIQGAHIEVQNKELIVYKSEIKIEAKLSGIRYMMYHFPITTGGVGVVTFSCFYLVVFLFAWLSCSGGDRRKSNVHKSQQYPPKPYHMDESQESDSDRNFSNSAGSIHVGAKPKTEDITNSSGLDRLSLDSSRHDAGVSQDFRQRKF